MSLTEKEKQMLEKKIEELRAQRAGLCNVKAGIEVRFDGRSRYMSEKERQELFAEEEECDKKIGEIDLQIKALEKQLSVQNKTFRR